MSVTLPYIEYPKANPIRFVPVNTYYSPRIHIPTMDATWFRLAIQQWQNNSLYNQKIQLNDFIQGQFHSSCTSAQIQIVNCSGQILYTGTPTKYTVSGNNATITKNTSSASYSYTITGLNTYHFKITAETAGITTNGIYYLVFTGIFPDSSTTSYISEPLNIKSDWSGTILFEYFNSTNTHDIFFIQPDALLSFRCEGALTNFLPYFDDTDYAQDNGNLILLNSVPYRKFTLNIAGKTGAPDWIFDKVNYALSCDNCRIEGKQYTRDAGAQWAMAPAILTAVQTGTLLVRETKGNEAVTLSNITPLLIYAFSGYDYVIESIALTDIFGNTTTIPTAFSIITDGSDRNGLIADLNKNAVLSGLYGYFYADSTTGNVFYQNAVNEFFITNASVVGTFITTFSFISVTSSTTLSFTVYSISAFSIDWGVGTVIHYPATGLGGTIVTNTYLTSIGSVTVKLYHSDNILKLAVSDTHFVAIGGAMSAMLTNYSWLCNSGATFDLTPFARAIDTLKVLTITGGLISIANANKAWNALNNVDLRTNQLPVSQVDGFFINFYNGILTSSPPPGTGGFIKIENQTPSAHPTSSSSAARTGLTTTFGFTITND